MNFNSTALPNHPINMSAAIRDAASQLTEIDAHAEKKFSVQLRYLMMCDAWQSFKERYYALDKFYTDVLNIPIKAEVQ